MTGQRYELFKDEVLFDYVDVTMDAIDVYTIIQALRFYVKDKSLSYGKIAKIVELEKTFEKIYNGEVKKAEEQQ